MVQWVTRTAYNIIKTDTIQCIYVVGVVVNQNNKDIGNIARCRFHSSGMHTTTLVLGGKLLLLVYVGDSQSSRWCCTESSNSHIKIAANDRD